MASRLSTVRRFFEAKQDPYAGADMANARRLGAVLWGLLVALMIILWASSPPNEAIGRAGWLVAFVVAGCGVALVWDLRAGRVVTTWDRLLAVSYGAVLAIAVMQWLSGGVASPYERMILLPTLFVATLHPPRRIACFMGFVAIIMAVPFVYDGWNSEAAGATFTTFVVWAALAVLGAVLMQGVRAQRLAAAAEEANAREEARIDSLTGLHNRRAFDEQLEVEVERARTANAPLCVAMIDMHDFKQINDGYGHAEGDRCLREVATVLKRTVRRPDLCFRWGGDEFALILSATGEGDARPLGMRISHAIAESCVRPDGDPMEISFALAELRIGMSAKELGELAGMALTSAKSRSRAPLPEGLRGLS